MVRIEDTYGNLINTDSSTVVSATRDAGTAVLQGTTSALAVNGVATFSSLSYNKAETITIDFNGGTLAVDAPQPAGSQTQNGAWDLDGGVAVGNPPSTTDSELLATGAFYGFQFAAQIAA